MTENQEKITSAKNIEEQERLKAKYEEEKEALEQENLTLKNTITKKNDEIFELQKANKRIAEERDDWKTEANARAKIQQESKQHKEQKDFETEFKNLQAKKGLQWDETQQTWTNINPIN